MKLSFIVPVYNAEKYLQGCIDSLYRQNLSEEDFEIICVNDGSTDSSIELLKLYAESHSNFIVINQENKGLSGARNAGMNKARGSYIRFIDSDDYIADNVTKKLLDIAIQNNLDVLFSGNLPTESDSLFKPEYEEYPEQIQIMKGRDYFSSGSTENYAWQYFIKREFIEENSFRFVEGRCLEDGMFTISLICKAERVAYCNVDYYRYVKRANSIMNNRNEKHLLKMIDDYCFVVLYINQIIKTEKHREENTRFINELMKRRDSYTFFMQIRMLRSSISLSKLKEYMNTLADNNLYPYPGLAQHYGKKLVFISKLMNRRPVYMIISYLTRIPCVRHLCESLMGAVFK